MGFLSVRPNSNERPPSNPYGGDEFCDDTCLLLNGLGKRCDGCHRVTRNNFLENGMCPDCRPKVPVA